MSKLVDVEVTEQKTNGVIVKILEDNRAGRIRLRELSWDRSVRSIPKMPNVGEILKAKIIRDRRKARYVELSLRQLDDPWEEVEEEIKIDHVVRGEIVNIRRYGAFVQLKPGFDAILRPEDVPLRPGQLPKDKLSIGDQIEAVVTTVDIKRHKIAISLIKRLQQLNNMTAEERRPIQLERLGCIDKTGEIENTVAIDAEQKGSHRYHEAIQWPEKILVIDDDEESLETICEFLEKKLSSEVVRALTGNEAVQQVLSDPSIGLAVIDRNLGMETGRQIAQKLLQYSRDLPILFTSRAALHNGDYISLDGRRFLFTEKEPEVIVDSIEKLCQGYWEKINDPGSVALAGQGSFLDQLGMSAFAQQTLADTLSQMLSDLRAETQATRCMVLEVDSVNKAVSLLAVEPPLEEKFQKEFLDGLYYSPVQNVVEDELNFYLENIKPWNKRFQHFRPLFPIKACYGVPLKIPGLVTRHALFLLDEQRTSLGSQNLEQTRLTAKFIQMALERDILLTYMRRYEKRYSRGKLLDSFAHEIANKLDGLASLTMSLKHNVQKTKFSEDTQKRTRWLSNVEDIAGEISEAKTEMSEMAKAYQSLASGVLDCVDVNQVVKSVKLRMDMKASELGSEIHLIMPSFLPEAYVIQSRLEQSITNLVLNAIQQIAAQRKFFNEVRKERPSFDILEHGQIILQTRYNQAQPLFPIQILVVDTGPGIHYQQQESIFLLDTTSRQEGHGVGLYHSRNLIETMGGRIRLIDSLMFIGSAFVIELPAFREK